MGLDNDDLEQGAAVRLISERLTGAGNVAVSHGEPERGEDVLEMMVLSREPPGDSHGPG